MVHGIVGRAEEVAVLGGFLADALPEPRALLIEGEPGIGKTSLLRGLLASMSVGGGRLSLAGIYVLKGTVGFALVDASQASVPSQGAMTVQADTVIGRLP